MNIKHFAAIALRVLISILLITGCVTNNHVTSADYRRCTKCVNFIEDGKTKREEVLQKSDFYELLRELKTKNSTVLIFRFSSSVDNTAYVYHLVLIFDKN